MVGGLATSLLADAVKGRTGAVFMTRYLFDNNGSLSDFGYVFACRVFYGCFCTADP